MADSRKVGNIAMKGILYVAGVLLTVSLIIVGAPHKEYRALRLPPSKPVIDIWNIYGHGSSLV